MRLFLSTNVPEIQADIDSRLAGADDAAAKAAAEIQRSEQTRALVEALVAKLTSQNLNAPERVDINAAPAVVTLTNPRAPENQGGALFPASRSALSCSSATTRRSKLRPTAWFAQSLSGRSTVHAVATADTSVYKSLCIEVVPPRLRLAAAGALRLDGKGNIRLT